MKKFLYAALLASLFIRQASADGFLSVENADDSGVGSLRAEVLQANIDGGTPTIFWDNGGAGGGTITLLSLLGIHANTTLDVTNAPSSGTLAGTGLSLSSATTFANGTLSQPWQIAAHIGGKASLTKTGSGSLTLSGVNSYAGGTIVQDGLLAFSKQSALGSGPLTLEDGATVQILARTLNYAHDIVLDGGQDAIETTGSSTTFSGRISGGGTLVKISSGILILTRSNTYTGGTKVLGGALRISSVHSIGSGALTLDGGALQVVNPITLTQPIVLGGGGGTLDTKGPNTELIVSGGISGPAGLLTKIGEGTLVLAGVDGGNTYGGGTSVNAGSLRWGVNNALPTGGAVFVASRARLDLNGFSQTNTIGDLANYGTLNVGAGTLSLGAYSGKGTMAIWVDNAAPGTKISATGLTLTQTTLNFNFSPSVLSDLVNHPNQAFPSLITGARGGTQFAKIATPAAFTLQADYSNPNAVSFTAQAVAFRSIAATANQLTIGTALEPLRKSPSADANAVLANLYSLNTPALRAALDQIGPLSLGAVNALGLTNSSLQSAAVNQRMIALAQERSGNGLDAYAVRKRSVFPGTLYAEALGDSDSRDQDRAYQYNSRWGYFGSIVGTNGKLADAASDYGRQPGYVFDSAGAVAGADYRVNDNLATGFAVGYLHGHSSIHTSGGGTIDNDSGRLGLYSTVHGGDFHANLYLGGAYDSFSTRRGIRFAGLARTAEGSPSGGELNVSVAGGYDIRTAQWGIFSPFADMSYDRFMVGAFSEKGADTLDLTVGAQTPESLRSTLGLRYSQVLKSETSAYRPYCSLGWRHEFDTQSRPIEAQLASGASAPFAVSTGNSTPDGTAVGAGLAIDWSQTVALSFDYSGDFRSHFFENSFTGTLRYRF